MQGFRKEYNPFIMMIYGKGEQKNIYDVEALQYVQEAQFDKYRQELVIPSSMAIVIHALVNSITSENGHNFGANQSCRGRGRQNYGRGRWR